MIDFILKAKIASFIHINWDHKTFFLAASHPYNITCLLEKLLIYFTINLKDNSSAGCPVIRSRKSSTRRTNRSNSVAMQHYRAMEKRRKKPFQLIDAVSCLMDATWANNLRHAARRAGAPFGKQGPNPKKKPRREKISDSQRGYWGVEHAGFCRKCNCRMQPPRPPKKMKSN